MTCKACYSSRLQAVFSLGNLPLPNHLLDTPDEIAPRAPLDMYLCPDCGLLQLGGAVDVEGVFREYVYHSSMSRTFLFHVETLARRLYRERRLNADSIVLEVGSNDGYLLQYYKALGARVLGVDPARNLAAIANRRGITTLPEFFGADRAATLPQADVIHAHNVLAHVPDLNDFVAGLKTALKPDGLLVIEVPYVRDMVETCAFDTIYHEHLFYFSQRSLDNLLARHGLTVQAVEHYPDIHAGTLRIFAGHGHADTPVIEDERLCDPDYYDTFMHRVRLLTTELKNLMADYKATGKTIAGYGASAKGNVLTNYAGIDELDYICDNTLAKQGKYTPGTRFPILPPFEWRMRRPDVTLLLAWNFAEEILGKEREYIQTGGTFIIPLPRLQLVNQETLKIEIDA